MGATSYLDGIVHRKKDLKAQLDDTMRLLSEQQAKLRLKINNLQVREAELLRSCALLIKRRDRARAKIYASEVVEIHKALSILQQTELVVEALKLRIGTAKELGDAGAILKPVTHALVKVKHQVGALVPEIASNLDSVSNTLMSVLASTTTDANLLDFSETLSSDTVDAIIKEAQQLAEKRLKESLDTFSEGDLRPLLEYVKANGIESIKSITEVFDEVQNEEEYNAKQEGAFTVTLIDRDKDPLDAVYDYLKRNHGVIDVSRCCKELNMQREVVLNSLKLLEKQGKIRITTQEKAEQGLYV
ncbi:hypothetical protein B9Q13_02830 [Candidatus Marsarchaeota G2 archaeon ECH_B_SAG-G16]|uniref:Uncharacterized protein n=1 Tax=Candidatus Marsarchaeota G2 archaeon ECH_B_SAG-G16 TaxID=1978167 RepID=A0A2R6C2I5_9ARCH|nr:MAG: hypothetical protein B9Q13_02830 [Candidatus Marsarchaeota G2 archaeon ECH_B_SAG-G16]